jgi:hypothetical protein
VTQDCATGCGRPVGDAPCCTGCGDALRADLADLAGHLAAQLDVTLTRQDRIGTSSGATSSGPPEPYDPGAEAGATPRPLPFNAAASDVAWALQNTLTTTIRDLLENRPAVRPAARLARPRQGDWYREQERPAEARVDRCGWSDLPPTQCAHCKQVAA